MDEGALRARIQDMCATNSSINDGSYHVVIISDAVTSIDDLENESDIFSHQCSSALSVAELKAVYMEQLHAQNGEMTPHIQLSIDNRVLDDETIIGDLAKHNEAMIVLHASPASSPSYERLRPSMATTSRATSLAPISIFGQNTGSDAHGISRAVSLAPISPFGQNTGLEINRVRDSSRSQSPESDTESMFMPTLRLPTVSKPGTSGGEEVPSCTSRAYMTTAMANEDIRKITDVDNLEQIVTVVKPSFSACADELDKELGDGQGSNWQATIEDIMQIPRRKVITIAVVGSTGAGKSSFINALLGEGKLLPTNCAQACTAAAIEVMYNDEDDSQPPYRLEVEMYSTEEWAEELEKLIDTIRDDLQALKLESSDASIAYARLHAVYPRLTKKAIPAIDVDTLLEHEHVKAHLGHMEPLRAQHSLDIHNALQRYAATTIAGQDTTQAKRSPRQPELWPLIKCVRIFTRSPLLFNGVRIIDLPGIGDANAARVDIAEKYMVHCDEIWILADIVRAVDSQPARKLLCDQFKRQMKLDGLVNKVVFICTKTDIIKEDEAMDSLDIRDKIEPILLQIKSLEHQAESLEAALTLTLEEQSTLEDAFDDLRDKIEDCEDLLDEQAVPPPKRRRIQQDDTIQRSCHVGTSPSTMSDDLDGGETASDLKAKLRSLRASKKALREKFVEQKQRKADIETKLVQIRRIQEELSHSSLAICIRARNEQIRLRIQNDYLLGIRELDQEAAEKRNSASYDPSLDSVRDYRELANDFRVYCVSSDGYQSLNDQLQGKKKVLGFQSLEDTELPHLQAHCRRMTEAHRIAASRLFLQRCMDLLHTMKQVLSSEQLPSTRLSSEQECQLDCLNTFLEDLQLHMDKEITAFLKTMKGHAQKYVGKLYSGAKITAADAAVKTAKEWESLHWATYKAIMRHNGGPYTNRKGRYDFNKQLSIPFEKKIASGWERANHREMPLSIRNHTVRKTTMLRNFHEQVISSAAILEKEDFDAALMLSKLSLWEDDLEFRADNLITEMTKMHREANRTITPTIKQRMELVYNDNQGENGPGMFKRMKDNIEQFVGKKKYDMFDKCIANLDKTQRKSQRTLKQELHAEKDALLKEVGEEYSRAILGSSSSDLPLTELKRDRRAKLLHLVVELENEIMNEVRTANYTRKWNFVGAEGDGSKSEEEEEEDYEIISRSEIPPI